MPSVMSLNKQQYYGHPRNAFWPIMAALFNKDSPINYQQGVQLLQTNGIAVWDVSESCVRQGSLDSAIEQSTIEINDFVSLFAEYSELKYVFFNGGMAEALFKKHVSHTLPLDVNILSYTKLPSTSPAYAAMHYQDKLAVWVVLKELSKVALVSSLGKN